MASLADYIYEVKLGKDPNIDKIFNEALKQVFSDRYFNKIENKLTKRIDVIEKKGPANTVAWNKGTTIFINPNEFNKRDMKNKMKYLLHEFLHVLQHSKSGMFMRDFKELRNLSRKLFSISKKYTKDVGLFLTGKKVPGRFINHEEALSYLMNDSIQWNQINAKGRKVFLNELQKSGIFDLSSNFWRSRLQ